MKKVAVVLALGAVAFGVCLGIGWIMAKAIEQQ